MPVSGCQGTPYLPRPRGHRLRACYALRIFTVKNSTKRYAARSPAPAISAGTAGPRPRRVSGLGRSGTEKALKPRLSSRSRRDRIPPLVPVSGTANEYRPPAPAASSPRPTACGLGVRASSTPSSGRCAVLATLRDLPAQLSHRRLNAEATLRLRAQQKTELHDGKAAG